MEEIVRVKEACGDAHLKVMIEIAEMGSTTTCATPR